MADSERKTTGIPRPVNWPVIPQDPWIDYSESDELPDSPDSHLESAYEDANGMPFDPYD